VRARQHDLHGSAPDKCALEHIAKVCKADTGPSSGIDFTVLKKAA